MDFWLDIAFAVLLRAVKSQQSRLIMRSAFIKLTNTIALSYKRDEEFWTHVVVDFNEDKILP